MRNWSILPYSLSSFSVPLFNMRGLFFSIAAYSTALVSGSVIPRQDPNFAGYLISTFNDPSPRVFWHLSDGDSSSSFRILNDGNPITESNVGTKGVRDIYLTHNTARSEFFLIATGMLHK